ncbi:S-adenosylmethionine:tRNA ribosyltransferase-isomerase [hydrothermal vent metagenome]|uniref:S-adenosylmethionine:tRNA ribosyltransferase-isomerase n=1 Tax=hydrothermal vent metagenome TaxID=652676 RepID=A0A3B1CR49_9ZZZZ
MTSIDLYNYTLPDNLIAQRPASDRSSSRLMLLNRKDGSIGHSGFSSFPDMLDDGDTLVLNNTKVFPARLMARRMSGGKVEILLIRQHDGSVWDAYVGGLKKIQPGETLLIGDGRAELVEKLEGGAARFSFESRAEADRLIANFGLVPLPPYIKRPGGKIDESDRERYQTVYAKSKGSCAAPTAGLHFTGDILKRIIAKGVQLVEITLHVGPGTFKPVKSDVIEDHIMDRESYEISDEAAIAINKAKSDGRRIIAVGSTVTRTLESMALENGFIKPGAGSTSLYITPGFKFQVVDALLTNFHLPRSTLLILVSAFAGRGHVLKAYEKAIRERYCFYSYGDAMFIE